MKKREDIQPDKMETLVDTFWQKEYPSWDEERKNLYWLGLFRKEIEWPDEKGYQLSFFTSSRYLSWKEKESNIDQILDRILPFLDYEFEDGSGKLEILIRSRLYDGNQG
jgi:hypothetical protein